jgi:hypothetical protein
MTSSLTIAGRTTDAGNDLVTKRDLLKIADIVSQAIKSETRPLQERLLDAHARLAAVEALLAAQQKTLIDRPPVFDAGVWAAGQAYPKGAGCSWDGHFWICQRDGATDPPSGNSEQWRLSVRRGKQGREGKRCPGCSGLP